MKKKREVHEGIINLVHQKNSVDPLSKVSGNSILFFFCNFLLVLRQSFAVLKNLIIWKALKYLQNLKNCDDLRHHLVRMDGVLWHLEERFLSKVLVVVITSPKIIGS
jgi:hypothetical protein